MLHQRKCLGRPILLDIQHRQTAVAIALVGIHIERDMIKLLGLLGVGWIVRDGGEAIVGGADVVIAVGVARIVLNRELELLDGGA